MPQQAIPVVSRNNCCMSEEPGLPLPPVRCLTKEQAAAYPGIGVTLLLQIGPPPIKFGRRSVWDVVDLDRWLAD